MPFKRLGNANPHQAFSQLWEASDIEEKIRVAYAYYPEIWEAVTRHCRPGSRVLEAGCGLGGWLNRFHREGFEAYGVDFVAPAVERLRQFEPALKVSVQDCTAMDFPDHFFDIYFSLGVIEHLEEGPEPFLTEARRVLRPGGVGLISVPFRDFLLFGPNSPGAATFIQYEFTREEYETLLRANGFEVLEMVPYGYFLYPHAIPEFRADSPEPYALNAAGHEFVEHVRAHRLQRYAIMQLAVVQPVP